MDRTATQPVGQAQAAAVDRPAESRGLIARAAQALFDLLSSYGLTVAILLCLMVLVYFGTRMQEQHDLNEVVKWLFESWVCVIDTRELGILPFAFRWPGAALLLSLLAVNIICGGIVRMKKGRRTLGVLLVHVSVLFLLLAGLVQYAWGTNGFIKLFPNESTTTYQSFRDFELVVAEPRGDGSVREHLISAHELLRQPTIHGKDWPFSIVVRRYYGNCEPAQSRQQHAPDTVDGIHLRPIPSRQKMSDLPGALLEVVVPGQPAQLGIVWGLHRYPWTVTVNGGKWAIDLRQQVFDFVTPDGVPFEVRMEKFRKEFHPGVRMARHFSSDVTKVEAGGEQRFHIAMNEPMRYAGFMLSQNDWGPQDGSNGPFYSVLEVSTNPADRWQLWACVLIGAGLLLHFGSKLVKHVNHQSKVST